MSAADESDLVARCRRGEDAAFRELVDRFSPMVFALASRLIRPPVRPEDVAQETFLRVHRGLPHFRGDSALGTWIYRIVTNVAFELRGRERFQDQSLDDDQAGRPAPGARDRAFSDLELRDRLAKAMERLPPHYRVLVHGHYVKGVKYEELAAALQIPIGTVKTHLFRAKRRLRQVLEGDLA
jgi:RNA polymerase sigma-70 factor (ECF subfamily)